MKKRIISLILSAIMLVSTTVIPVVFADSESNPIFTIEADKETAKAGDTINYTIYMQQPDTITCFAFNISIADGLTLVDESVVLGKSASSLLGDTFSYTSPAETVDPLNYLPLLSWYSANSGDFTDKSKIELMTFKCTMDEDAKLDELYEVNLVNVEMMAGSTQNYADITDTIKVTAHYVYATTALPFVPSPSKPSTPQDPGTGGAGGSGDSADTPNKDEEKEPAKPNTSNSPYSDVAEGAYYYDPVIWAAETGVTTGTSATTFSPDMNCTRGQTVTFLWRAAGSPKTENAVNPFTDVKEGDYFYDAVLWAVEKGITTGTSATEFAPNAMVNRGQTVTFIWRLAGKTTVSAENIFTDVANDSYFKDAVLWAASEGITTGTSATTFHPDNGCTRGQIVTFIYRYFN